MAMRLWASGSIENDDKTACLQILLSFIVRRAVCGLTTKNYNKFFLTTVSHLDENGWSPTTLAAFLLNQKSETGRFPRDEEFEQRWLNSPSYTILQPTKAQAILEEIEIAKRTRFHETDQLATHLSIEHIMPWQWETHWH